TFMTQQGTQVSLTGKVALITGAARGLGAEIATTFSQAGAAVMITDILEDRGRETAAAIQAAGGKAAFVRQDVTREADWNAAVDATIREFGGLDILVNNAGIEICALVENTSLSDFQRILDINVTGVFLGLQAAARAMKPGGAAGCGGSVINLSSLAGLRGFSGRS